MSKFTAFIIIVALRIAYHPSNAQTGLVPFASQSPSPLPSVTNLSHPAKLISFNGSIINKRVFLQWEVSENETADQFEVEKSTDGKNFTIAALVFGTDKPETGNYWFYEKANTKKFYYRIKMITKTRKTEYSQVVEITPDT
jgi:hypothetical protein